jgi:hypothetical protein
VSGVSDLERETEMATFFADGAVQDTRGGRGKTTRRKGTRTVRGPEGAAIAQMKEELAARPAGWLVKEERVYWRSWSRTWEPRTFQLRRCDTEAEALAHAAAVAVGPEHTHQSVNGDNYATRAWVEREAK